MKKILLALGIAVAMASSAMASGNHNHNNGPIIWGAGNAAVWGNVDVDNLGVAVGDWTSAQSVSEKNLQGAIFFDSTTGNAGMQLKLGGRTAGISQARSRGPGSSLVFTGENGNLFISGGGQFGIGGGFN